jgi:hypothetical protein
MGYDYSSMRRIVANILCFICCIILVMPQGWCCFFSPLPCCKAESACCEVAKPVKPNCCCCEKTPTDTEESAPQPIKLKCPKCIHDVLKPTAKVVVDFDLFCIGLLEFDVASAVATISPNAIVSLFGDGPPLHLQLCIWRC